MYRQSKKKKRKSSKVCVSRVNDKIITLTFPTQDDMITALLRVEEHYECPSDKFRGKAFTLKEYKKWYTEKYGGFNYPDIVDGINIPFREFKPFLEGKFDPLNEKEEEVIELIEELNEDNYIIAVYDGVDSSTYEHELSHALYGTIPKYQRKVDGILKKYDKSLVKLRKFLKKQGYGNKHLKDEMNSFLGADYLYLKECDIDVPHTAVVELMKLKAEFLPKPYNPTEYIKEK